MANGRNPQSRGSGRDAGGFVALPWVVLDCANYRGLSANARSLLLEVARQYNSKNNGRLLLSRNYLGKRGWSSNDMISKGKRELLDGGFIYETVKGHRPNKASWYAITWQTLDKFDGYDYGVVKGFRQGVYQDVFKMNNHLVKPFCGTKGGVIAPPQGTSPLQAVPQSGAINGV
jgi:hypothetical protein